MYVPREPLQSRIFLIKDKLLFLLFWKFSALFLLKTSNSHIYIIKYRFKVDYRIIDLKVETFSQELTNK